MPGRFTAAIKLCMMTYVVLSACKQKTQITPGTGSSPVLTPDRSQPQEEKSDRSSRDSDERSSKRSSDDEVDAREDNFLDKIKQLADNQDDDDTANDDENDENDESNNSDTGTKLDGQSSDSSTPKTYSIANKDDLASACDDQVETHTQQVGFIPLTDACQWSGAQNENVINGFIEKEVILDLPDNAVICSMTFDFNPSTWSYGDGFTLSLDNILIMSSFDPGFLATFNEGLPSISRNLMQGRELPDASSQPFCLGEEQELASCTIPYPNGSSTTISRQQGKALTRKISMANIQRGQHTVHLMTFGDRDSTDCQHNGLRFNAQIEFVRNTTSNNQSASTAPANSP